MPHYAEFFVKAGLAVLIFDYRGLGASDGDPRQHVNPWDQIEDYGRIDFAAPDPVNILCTWPLPETFEVFTDLQKTEAPLHEHWSTTESTELLLNYTVFPYVPRILDIPTLMLAAEGDDLTLWDLETDAFNQIATSQKKLFVIPKTSHMSLYSNRSKLEIAAEVATAWLSDHLVKPYRSVGQAQGRSR
ncbi:MAG: alpha/beta hydrolase [Candidatus Methylomirabilia bacterium]